MMERLIKLRKLNFGKEKELMLAILALSTLLATGIFLIFVFNAIPAQAQSIETDQISGQIHLIGQVDVRNLPEASGTASNNNVIVPVLHRDEQQFAQEKALAESPGFVPPGQSEKIIINPSTTTSTVSLSSTLEGVNGNLPNPCICVPPDPNLGVGQNQVFEMVNIAGIIYNKDGTIAKNTFPLSGFFQLPTSPYSTNGLKLPTTTDPEILYDNGSHRWFASIIDVPNGSVRFAVSTSEDPTGSWNLYSTPKSSSRPPDQPFIGVSDDKFVISANDFAGRGRGSAFKGAQYWIFNKAELVAGVSTVDFVTNKPKCCSSSTTYMSVHPVRHLGSSSGLFYMVSIFPVGTASSATLFTVDGVPGVSTVTVKTNNFAINPISSPPSATQPGTSTTLETGDDRVLSAVWENNTLWFSASDACIPSVGDSTRSCARLIQITTAGTSPPTKVQDFDYASSGQYFFYPAVSLYQGQLVIVYGLSSSTIYPSLLVTGRAPSDSLNTLQTSATIRSGTAADLTGRYGDYFGAATDPNPTSNSTFWVAGEYRINSGLISWNTAIAQVGALV